jgi:transcriptional regulator with XRE-family HTH domain
MSPEQFKAKRQILGDTQASLAKKLGVTRGMVNFYEAGRYTIRPNIAILIDLLIKTNSKRRS